MVRFRASRPFLPILSCTYSGRGRSHARERGSKHRPEIRPERLGTVAPRAGARTEIRIGADRLEIGGIVPAPGMCGPDGAQPTLRPAGQDEGAGLFRIEVTEAAGSGTRILNQSPHTAFRESTQLAIQNLYSRARDLVGDRNPREHEFACSYARSMPHGARLKRGCHEEGDP